MMKPLPLIHNQFYIAFPEILKMALSCLQSLNINIPTMASYPIMVVNCIKGKDNYKGICVHVYHQLFKVCKKSRIKQKQEFWRSCYYICFVCLFFLECKLRGNSRSNCRLSNTMTWGKAHKANCMESCMLIKVVNT